MDTIITVVGGIAKAVALFGGTLAAVFVAYSGILWMIAGGDPQKMAQARNALIGSVVGLIIVGISFLIPPTVSELVIEPAGGVAIETINAFDCDGMLRTQLVARRWADTPPRMQRIISEIQAKQDECSSDRWNPEVKDPNPWGGDMCFKTVDDKRVVGSLLVPPTISENVPSGRDSRNNVVVHWELDKHPSDGSYCWLYVSDFGTWAEGYVG